MEDRSTTKKTVEEPPTVYQERKQQQGIGNDFNFDKEFAKGLTAEEAKALSKSLIRKWWKTEA
ncbi:hypothetical protein [Flavobacterium tegetincola]|uniref:hypothetical protein n=1 Tax=Flavobacterium tegetincola TaxID=150172 RepID=UPI0004218040|nr:hypothetical protein [Flavobacterium tegetincola]